MTHRWVVVRKVKQKWVKLNYMPNKTLILVCIRYKF